MQIITCMSSIPFSKRNDFLPARLEVISSDDDESVTGSLKFFDFNFVFLHLIFKEVFDEALDTAYT